MKGQTINTLIGVMIAIVIGVAVTANVVIDQTLKMTTATGITDTNDTLLRTNGIVQLSNFPVLNNSLSCYNATSAANTAVIDVNFTANLWTGTLNTSFVPADTRHWPTQWVSGKFNCTYVYSDKSYLTDSSARTIARQLPLLTIVAILVTGIIGALYAVLGRR